MSKKSKGRPQLFKTPEDMQKSIDDYYTNCIDNDVPLTITGVALALGFESRQSFYDYEKMSDFSYTIKRTRMYIENAYEMALQSKHTTGAIFALKNLGWSDKTETEISGQLDTVQYYAPRKDESK